MSRFITMVILLLTTASIFSAEITNVIDAFDGTDPFDFNFEINYEYKYQSTKLKREAYCLDGDVNCAYDKMGGNGIINFNQFMYTKKEHIIEPKLRFGLYKDLELYLALPIYLSSTRNIGFDSSAKNAALDTNNDGKVDSSDGTPTHNGASNTFWNTENTGGNDLFLPYKYEKEWSGGELFPDKGLDFERSGLSTLNVGVKYGILDNDRDDTDPTWMVGIEYNAPIATPIEYYSTKKLTQMLNGSGYDGLTATELQNIMKNRLDLSSSTMGDGVHHIKFETGLSKRYGIADAYMSFNYDFLIAGSNSIYTDEANREFDKPGDNFNFGVGVELIPWEKSIRNSETDEKTVLGTFSIDLFLQFAHQMKGLTLSELSDYLGIPTVVDSYSTITGKLALRFMPVKYVKINFGASFSYVTDHFLTNQPKGVDKNGDGVYTTDEYDPMYSANTSYFNSFNTIGNRIFATETLLMSFFVNMQLQF
ncbi:hypothetical protein JXR93_01905 [bacterium]|nr:hypothetical protein [bacterium]